MIPNNDANCLDVVIKLVEYYVFLLKFDQLGILFFERISGTLLGFPSLFFRLDVGKCWIPINRME